MRLVVIFFARTSQWYPTFSKCHQPFESIRNTLNTSHGVSSNVRVNII